MVICISKPTDSQINNRFSNYYIYGSFSAGSNTFFTEMLSRWKENWDIGNCNELKRHLQTCHCFQILQTWAHYTVRIRMIRLLQCHVITPMFTVSDTTAPVSVKELAMPELSTCHFSVWGAQKKGKKPQASLQLFALSETQIISCLWWQRNRGIKVSNPGAAAARCQAGTNPASPTEGAKQCEVADVGHLNHIKCLNNSHWNWAKFNLNKLKVLLTFSILNMFSQHPYRWQTLPT